MTAPTSKNPVEVINELWHRGVLTWKLNSCQKTIYNLYKNTTYKKMVVNSSRRIGKSYTLLIIALELAISRPGAQIKFACPTARAAKKIIIPTLLKLLKDCPKDLKPAYSKQEGIYTFPNGSQIHIEGVDGANKERLRGTASDLSIVDEAGFVDELDYVINDILLPMAVTTKGRIILSSTPPKSPDHDFIKYVKEAEFNGTYIRKTIMDALKEIQNDPIHLQHISKEEVDAIREASGGEQSLSWRREWMAELIKDNSLAIIGEFTEEIEAECVRDWQRPGKYDAYTSLDLGWKDFHAVLFAYYDFRNAKLVIEDEYLIPGKQTNTSILAAQIKNKESVLWRDPVSDNSQEPYIRVADDDMIVLNDLQILHSLTFLATKKDNKDAALNDLKLKILTKKIIINPRCRQLIFQLKTGIWEKNKKDFARSADGGHSDLIDSLIYLVRNVQWHKNPYPADWDDPKGEFFKSPKSEQLSPTGKTIKDLFIKPKFKFGRR